MKAAFVTDFGGPEVFRVADMATPEPKPGHVLLRITAAGLNYYDTLVRRGAVSKEMPLPHILGSDVVGCIEAVGEGVDRFSVGDAVIVAPGFPIDPAHWQHERENYAQSFYPGGTFNHGGYAQFMVMHERWLLANESELSDYELATLPLVLVTAVHAVQTLGGVGEGTSVLVHAGASGSGSMAIQLAKALGAQVITTVSTPYKARLAKRLGADQVIFYQQDDFARASQSWTAGEGVDVIIDNLGGDVLQKNLEALRWGGKLVNFGLMAGVEATIPNIYHFFRGQYQIFGSFMGTMKELQQGLEWVKAGKIKPVLDEVLPLGEVQTAHTRIDTHQVAGNLVLDPWA